VEIAPRKPAEQQEGEESSRAAPTSPTTPTAPTPPQDGAGTDLSPQQIFGLPPEDTAPTTAPSLGAPLEETPDSAPLTPPAGGEMPPTTEPLDDPMGDQDLPPALPFAAPKFSNQPLELSNGNRPAAPSSKGDVRMAPQEDPPPSLPAALASVSS
jgi:hypothetical protein